MKKAIILTLILLVGVACKKEIILSDIPEISLIKTSPTTVTSLQEPIYFEIEYTDGNGDLGENDPDAKNLTLIDTRINIKYEYRIKELVPNGANVPITGRLLFSIPNAFITNGETSQTVEYKIYVTDRAGNKSNEISSGKITIVQ